MVGVIDWCTLSGAIRPSWYKSAIGTNQTYALSEYNHGSVSKKCLHFFPSSITYYERLFITFFCECILVATRLCIIRPMCTPAGIFSGEDSQSFFFQIPWGLNLNFLSLLWSKSALETTACPPARGRHILTRAGNFSDLPARPGR